MYTITVNVKTEAELNKLAARISGNVPVADDKTLKDFPLQEIIEHIQGQGYEIIRPGDKEDAAPAVTEAEQEEIEEKPKAPKKGKAKAAETAETAEPEKTPEELKDIAVKHIMAVYNDPKGKAAAQALLKDFGVKNFHLIPSERWIELHEKTITELGKLGLI